ncbi:hypothetical protein KP509_31G000100 [Ceratopteris richardii]|uniref:Uncharacterized protein n=1 Tax=Ceratopteris richardii TaxID=49495 RepID=A0A8T2QUW4_CERRI|nr:hypothetical protein KP509_31G000100 [Ceratopteris richardii]
MTQPPQLGQWTSGFCDCFSDCGSCCITYCCPCISVGEIVNVADRGQSSFCEGCCIYAALQFCLCGMGCFYSCMYRKKVREMFNLPASPCDDFFAECLCPLCSITQTYRELKNRGMDPSKGYQNAPQSAPAPQFMRK